MRLERGKREREKFKEGRGGGERENRVDGGSQHGGNKPRRGDVYFGRV